MSDNINYRVKEWTPPARPAWVQRVNDEGKCLDLKSVVPLDEDSLIDRAKQNTGLGDFGREDWHEPFQVFIKALDEEADLTLMGRLMTRSDILMHLEARLRIEETYKQSPEIADQEIASPLLIVGSGRSGTSAIQNLLAQDPENASPTHWEALFPYPPPEAATYLTDPRIAIADQRMDQWNRVTPEIMSIHEFRGHMPTEMIQLETMSFQSNGWLDLYGFVPSYNAYMAARSWIPAFSYAKRILKLLQWKNPHRRWILKSPDAMRHLPDLFEIFPDMQLVWMHRDPIKTVSSSVNMVGTLFWIRSDQPLSELAIAQLTNPAGLAGFFGRVIDQIEQGLVPSHQLHSIQYVDYVADPVGAVAKLYREMGLTLGGDARQAMTSYLREQPRESRPAHRYSTGDIARQTEERKLFERYLTYFNVKIET